MKTFPFPTTAHAARSLGAAALVLGASLGLDRLLMVLLDLDSIDQVLTFRD